MLDATLIDLRNEEEMILGRHALQASHARAGALFVLDMAELDPWTGFDACKLLGELMRTTEGNGQRLVAIGKPSAIGWDRCPGAAGLEFYPDLATALRIEAPVTDRTYALKLTLPARVEHLAPVKQHLAGVVRALHGDAEAFSSEILIDEMALNAVENSPSSRNAYDLAFSLENHELRVEVTNDFDEAVDSTRIMNRRLQSFDDSGRYLGERGRGLFLIARIADGLQIRAVDGDRVRVTVTKNLR